MQRVELNEAKMHLAELIEAATQGQEVVITKNDRPVVKLVPIPGTKPRPRFGSAKGLIQMAEDFDAPLEDFNEYMK